MGWALMKRLEGTNWTVFALPSLALLRHRDGANCKNRTDDEPAGAFILNFSVSRAMGHKSVSLSVSLYLSVYLSVLFLSLSLGVLGFELRALCLLGRHSTT
jgi:hypothetical protein